MFVMKVGNLTGGGIDWSPRARNYIAAAERKKPPLLQPNDILMTSSAHSLVYIAKKIDMVGEPPDWIGDAVTFVGELLLVRPNRDLVDPFLLLAFLRMPSTGEALRSMASGQTAHLLPQDVAELGVPAAAISSEGPLKEVAALLRQELELSRRVNELAHRQATLFATVADVQD
jgi:type I restriction enzyme M protein